MKLEALLMQAFLVAVFIRAEHHNLSVMFGHVSNACFSNPNEGMDTVGLRY